MAERVWRDLPLWVALLIGTLSGARVLRGVPAVADSAPRARAAVAVAFPHGRLAPRWVSARAVPVEHAAPHVGAARLPARAAAPTAGAVQAGHDAAVLPTRVAVPTRTPTPTRVPTATASPLPWSQPVSPRPGDWRPQLRPRRDPRNAASLFDPAALPASLVGVNFVGPRLAAAQLLPTATPGVPSPEAGVAPLPFSAWAVEIVYTSDPRFDEQLVARLVDATQRGFRVLLRVDYARKQPVPEANDPVAVQAYVDTFLRYWALTEGRVRFYILGNEGNVDAPGDDPNRTTECLAGRSACSPENYARVYRQVRWALRSRTDAYLIVGAVSPGSSADPVRWMDGAAYLQAMLAQLHPLEVDGIALHAYGGQNAAVAQGDALGNFIHETEGQLAALTAAGYLSTPLFLTEINQHQLPSPGFVSGAYRWLDEHNRRSGQDIVAACWFTYHDETGVWGEMALERHPEIVAALGAAAETPPGR